MAKFATDQTAAVAALQQLINEWAVDLDLHHGEHVPALLTEDCSYVVGNELRGRAAVAKFYGDRLARLSAQPGGLPTIRHLNANLLVNFHGEDEASITFNMLNFTTDGHGSTLPDPAAVADVRMTCRREKDGHWRISRFDSNRPFVRRPT